MQKETLFDLFWETQKKAKNDIIDFLSQYVDEVPNHKIDFNDNAIMNGIKYISFYKDENDNLVRLFKTLSDDMEYNEKINNNYTSIDELGRIASMIKNNQLCKYKWIADSDDDCFHDESTKMFKTEKEAYEDMRNAALEKIKWNTDYTDISQNNDLDEDYIGYNIRFFQGKIIHESYSGIYTYQIVKI